MNGWQRILLCAALLYPLMVNAHSLNDSFLDLTVSGTELTGATRLSVSDLELAIGLDRDSDTNVLWGEIIQARVSINAYLLQHLSVARGSELCSFAVGEYKLSMLSGSPYLVVPFQGNCFASGALRVSFDPFFEFDASHRSVAKLNVEDISTSRVFSPSNSVITIEKGSNNLMKTIQEFVWEGIWHIWIGIDHILFLGAMLVATLVQQPRNSTSRMASTKFMSRFRLGLYQPKPLRESLWLVAKVVTAFTLAHSITLILATLQLVSLSAQLVESAIALSVALSGVNLIIPIFGGRHAVVAFLFGLIHGFGFANVLTQLDLSSGQFLTGLLSFNVGVEIGQLAIVCLVVPLLLGLFRYRMCRRVVTFASGLVIAQFGMVWLMDRGFGISFNGLIS